ncbi:uncharacterized protein PODANS_2_5525 [Podospora anserina S mat+]|uniref:Podospora anserina S mat+ genomic DNA chromosome 2, supercontig 2 n=1 Tax=Podospora anserina (strain S / ATCC MYA-4624 / DSM 980 / FGSC 10383) TaxID=515849 RepID=B2B5R3_PODAN|nr:uncharacterized protein PODANS_2_5525 [Podospora anserina S mat+]CAP73138.1 unnamed protein product [Podospora anserina S mat+]CDP25540.1 Putative protein of unknown function [Podospora anserina S mat+]
MFRGVGWRRRHSQEEIERAARVLGMPVPVPGSRGSSRGRVLPTDGGWERCSTSSSGEVESTRPSVVPPRRSGQRRSRRPGDGWEADDELRKGSGERSEEEIAWSVGPEERPSTPPRVGFCEGEGGEEGGGEQEGSGEEDGGEQGEKGGDDKKRKRSRSPGGSERQGKKRRRGSKPPSAEASEESEVDLNDNPSAEAPEERSDVEMDDEEVDDEPAEEQAEVQMDDEQTDDESPAQPQAPPQAQPPPPPQLPPQPSPVTRRSTRSSTAREPGFYAEVNTSTGRKNSSRNNHWRGRFG